MKKLITIFLLLLLTLSINSQLGKFSATVTYTTSNNNPVIGEHVQYCVTIENFTQCSSNWFDGLQIITQNATIISYDLEPTVDWLDDTESIDEPINWYGWSYDNSGDGNTSWDDYGHSNSNSGGLYTFCFTVRLDGAPCNIQVSLWSDYDIGSWGNGCGIRGVPDGPYTLYSNTSLPVGLSFFDGDCNRLNWETSSEINSSHFEIEKSVDGSNWNNTGIKVPAYGNSNQPISYYADINPDLPLQYYRLVQYDLDGKKDIFKPISLYCNSKNQESIQVFNSLGQYITSNIEDVKVPGVYLVRYKDLTTKKVVK